MIIVRIIFIDFLKHITTNLLKRVCLEQSQNQTGLVVTVSTVFKILRFICLRTLLDKDKQSSLLETVTNFSCKNLLHNIEPRCQCYSVICHICSSKVSLSVCRYEAFSGSKDIDNKTERHLTHILLENIHKSWKKKVL